MNAARPMMATSAATTTAVPLPGAPALAQLAASTSAVTVTPRTTAPAMSNLRPERPAMCGTATTASASATRPTGMLIQKTQRHPQASVMRPPTIGPDEDRDRERRADDREHARPLARGGDLADDRLRHQVQAGRADALHDARERELGHVLRESAEQRRHEEHDERS